MNTTTPTLDQLKRGLQIAEQIAALEAEMAALFLGKGASHSSISATVGKAQGAKKGRRKFSAQALANIRAAQKRRWAKVAGRKAASGSVEKKKRKLSPKALANIRAAQKKRWAKVKGAAAPAKAGAKKAPAAKKRKLAPEVRAKLAAAMKARWEAAKKNGGPPPTAKK